MFSKEFEPWGKILTKPVALLFLSEGRNTSAKKVGAIHCVSGQADLVASTFYEGLGVVVCEGRRRLLRELGRGPRGGGGGGHVVLPGDRGWRRGRRENNRDMRLLVGSVGR